MAGDWIKVESATPDKPELVRMAQILGIDQDAVFGKVFRLWAWADQNIALADDVGNDEGNDDSVTTIVTEAFVDRLTFCSGFAKAMVATGWLVFTEDGIRLPNFKRHNGETAKTRALTARRVAKAKKKADAPGVSSVTRPALPDALPREEKRREDLKAPLSHSAGEGGVAVTDGDGKPAAPLDDAKAIGVGVPAAKRLRSIGIRVTALDPTLLALCAEKFSVEDMALMAAEQVLRKVHLWNDSEVHPDLPELLASAAKQQQMLLTDAQYSAMQAAAAEIGINYIATALRGRRQDAIDKQSPNRPPPKNGARKPSATDNFEGKIYAGTPVDRIHPSLRPSGEDLV
jgi:hypothetical protein